MSLSIKKTKKFPEQKSSSSYSRYANYVKKSFLLHRLSSDSGYPEEFHRPVQKTQRKDFLSLNKKNLRNFFKDRIPTDGISIQAKVQMISPSQITKIKQQQLRLKDLTRSRMHDSLQINSQKMVTKSRINQEDNSLEKMNNAFQITDKNKEIRQNFSSIRNKKCIRYDLPNHRLGTTCFIGKRSEIIKKQAYENVFGIDISSLSRTCEITQKTKDNEFLQNKLKYSLYMENKEKVKQAHSKQFKRVIQKMAQFEGNTIKYSSKKQGEQSVMDQQNDNQLMEWIKGFILQKKEQLCLAKIQMKTLEDLKKIDNKFYKEMVNHKKRRLNVRKINLTNTSNQFVNTPVPSIQCLSINRNQSLLSSSTERTLKCQNSIFQRKIKFNIIPISQKVLRISFQGLIYGISPKYMIDAFFSKKGPYSKEGSFIFFNAIRNGDLKIVEKFVKSDQIYLFEKDQNYFSPLMVAVKYNHLQIVNFLICKGINIDYQSKNKKKALFLAVINNNVEIITLLLRSGASPWSEKHFTYNKMSLSPNVLNLFKNAKMISIASQLTKRPNRLEFWKNHKHLIRKQQILKFH